MRAAARVVALKFDFASTKQLLANSEVIAAQVEQSTRYIVLIALGELEFCEDLRGLCLACAIVLDPRSVTSSQFFFIYIFNTLVVINNV